MADNVTIPATGSGSATPVVATDDVAGAHYQRVKLDLGGDGASVPVVGALPVTDAGGSFTVDSPQLPAALVGGRLDVNIGATIAVPVTDNAGSLTVDSAQLPAALVGGRLSVDGSGVTQPVSGTVTANIGTSGSLALDATLTGGTQKSKLVDTGGTNVATVSAGGALKVDGSAATQPVSGTVTANAGTGPFPVSDNAGSLTVDAPVGTPLATRLSDGAAFLTTTGGRLSVDASGVAVPITDNAGSLTVDNAGTFAVQDNQVVADNAAFTDGTTKVFAAGYVFDEVAGTALTENDAAAARIDSKRAQVLVLEDATTRGQRASVDATGALKVTGGGGGSQVTEDAASTGGELGTLAFGYRQDADTSPVSASGDYHGLIFDALGNLKVNVKAGSSGGPSKVDDSAFGVATDSVAPAGYLADEVTPDSVDEGDVGLARMSLNRNVYTQIRDGSAERSAAVSAANALKVDGSGVTQPVSGTVTANAGTGPFPVSDNAGTLTVDAPVGTPVFVRLSDGAAPITALPITDNAGSLTVDNAGTFAVQDSEKVADNAAFTDGTTKVQPVGFIFDEVAGTALTENDIGASRMDSKRAQVGVLEDATTRGQRAAISAAGRLSVDASGVAVPITDNAGSLTVDQATGSNLHTVLDSGTLSTITNVVHVDDNAASLTIDSPGVPTALGQSTMANSMRVAVASDQTALPITDNAGSLTVDAPVGTPVFARLSDGAATLIGQKVMASSLPVAIASDQSAIPEKFDAVASTTVGASSVTVNGQIHAVVCTGYSTVICTWIADAGTQSTPEQVTFEGSMDGGTNWHQIVATRIDSISAAPVLNVTTAVSTRQMFQINCAGLTNVRLNQTVQIVGTGTVNWRLNASGAPGPLLAATDQLLLAGTLVDTNSGAKSAGTQRVTIATDQVQLTNALKVDGSAVVQPVGGNVAADAAVTGNPLLGGGRASNAVPTVMSADGDAVTQWMLRQGAAVMALAPHLGMLSDPYALTSKTAQYTTTQTGVALWTPAGGKKVVITAVQIQAGGTTAGTVQLWFGASADTTYTRGTDLAIFDGEFAPSATLKPGVIQSGCWIAGTADHILRVTDSAAVNPLTITVWGYEV